MKLLNASRSNEALSSTSQLIIQRERSMTQTYRQIQKKIEALQRQADKLRDAEIQGVTSRIKVAITHYGLTAEQLGFGTKPSPAKANQGRTSATQPAKYSDGNGNSWSGRLRSTLRGNHESPRRKALVLASRARDGRGAIPLTQE
jgi:DNA-binding protein H-NS